MWLNFQCFGWSWYLSNDMQFYVIAPIVLIPWALRSVISRLSVPLSVCWFLCVRLPACLPACLRVRVCVCVCVCACVCVCVCVCVLTQTVHFVLKGEHEP